MTFRCWIATCFAAVAIGNGLVQQLGACDQCRGKTPCRACRPTDDRGLLDFLDSAAQKVHPCLPKLRMPRLPSLDTALGKAFGGQCRQADCGCEVSPSCGCESSPSCGCEVREPSCGCEDSGACGCQSGQMVYSTHPTPAPSGPTHGHLHSMAPYDQPYTAPMSVPDHRTPPGPPAAPAPLRSTTPFISPEPMPLPDSEVDPFRDDSAARVRRIPARSIQYRRPASNASNYGQNYDPQAAVVPAQIRRSDGVETQASRLALDATSSSRLRSTRSSFQSSLSDDSESAVITASGNLPSRILATPAARPVPRNANPAESFNPLRPN